MKSNLTILVASIGLFSISVLSQARAITQADLWKATFDANKISEKIRPRRIIAEQKNFKNGELWSSSVITTDYDADGNESVVNVYKRGDKTEIRTMIRIGDVYYCRDDNTAWERSLQFCGEMSLSALPNTETSKIMSEHIVIDGEKVVYYYSYVTHRGWGGQKGDSEPLRFIEHKFWVNENGSGRKWEESMGFVDSKSITKLSSTTYEYIVKISKILAPIK